MDKIENIKNIDYRHHLEQYLKNNPNMPKIMYAAVFVPSLYMIVRRSDNLRLLSNSSIKLAASCFSVGAASRVSYMYASGEFKNPRKYTENDILDNKAFLLASAASMGGYLGGAASGFVFSWFSLGCESVAIGWRYFCAMYPKTVPVPPAKAPAKAPAKK